ncbi:unnamed protein product, partial [Brassica napus]
QKNHPWPPIGALVYNWREEPCKSRFDDLVNAVSSGFVVTDILISMFLVMAIFEKLIEHLLSQIPLLVGYFGYGVLVRFSGVASKLGYQSPKASIVLVAFSLRQQIMRMFTALPSLSLASTCG